MQILLIMMRLISRMILTLKKLSSYNHGHVQKQCEHDDGWVSNGLCIRTRIYKFHRWKMVRVVQCIIKPNQDALYVDVCRLVRQNFDSELHSPTMLKPMIKLVPATHLFFRSRIPVENLPLLLDQTFFLEIQCNKKSKYAFFTLKCNEGNQNMRCLCFINSNISLNTYIRIKQYLFEISLHTGTTES